jgi:hypothetical protein
VKACDALQAILGICHRAVEGRSLIGEWMDHQSIYASAWRVAMKRRGKIVQFGDDAPPKWVLQRIDHSDLHASHKEAIAKDLHLLETARRYDLVVVTNDLHLARLVAALLTAVPRLARRYQGIRMVTPEDVVGGRLVEP